MGRALGEAMIYPDLIRSCSAIFFHDLVRNGPGFGNYFQRLDYYPDHKPGCRYHWQADGEALRLVQPHHVGAICLNRAGIAVSRNAKGLYVSLCNGTEETRRVRMRLAGVRPANKVRLESMRAASLDCWGYDYVTGQAEGRAEGGNSLAVQVPPCCLMAGQVPLRQ
jgi:hypothetical protein